jgi:ribosome silencing factor RsfS/YbeB/iojap
MEKRVEEIISILDSKKAEDIVSVDLQDKDYIANYVVVATSLNGKHAFSLLNYLKDALKPKGEEFLRVDEDDEWTIVDLGDILVHLITENYREKYSLDNFLEILKRSNTKE